MTASTARQTPAALTDEAVAEWLRANPDFFRRNSELLPHCGCRMPAARPYH